MKVKLIHGIVTTLPWQSPRQELPAGEIVEIEPASNVPGDAYWLVSPLPPHDYGVLIDKKDFIPYEENTDGRPALDNRELATVLAALRYYQQGLIEDIVDPRFRIIAMDHFELPDPLTADDIDTLCERLNTDG